MSTILEEIIRATVDGDEEKTVALARQAMEVGMEPFDVIQNGYARGMEIVGEKFATLEYFLPAGLAFAARQFETAPGDGAYDGLIFAGVADRRPSRGYPRADRRLRHNATVPDHVNHPVFAHHRSRIFYQELK